MFNSCKPKISYVPANFIEQKAVFENVRAVFHRYCSLAIACSPRYALLHCGLPALSGLFTGGCSKTRNSNTKPLHLNLIEPNSSRFK